MLASGTGECSQCVSPGMRGRAQVAGPKSVNQGGQFPETGSPRACCGVDLCPARSLAKDLLCSIAPLGCS